MSGQGLSPLKDRVQGHLAVLIGTPLWGCGRAADLLWLQFGARHPLVSPRGVTRDVGDYALHLQSAWMISGPEGMILRSDAPDIKEALAVFGTSRLPRLVELLTADVSGGFELFLDEGYRIHVLPGDADEQWRLLRPGRLDVPHVVFENGSLDVLG